MRVEGRIKGSNLQIVITIIIGKHIQIFCFKFQQNRTINEKFDFIDMRGGGEAPGR